MGVSLIYRSRTAYELAMLALYRSHYAERYEAIATLFRAERKYRSCAVDLQE